MTIFSLSQCKLKTYSKKLEKHLQLEWIYEEDKIAKTELTVPQATHSSPVLVAPEQEQLKVLSALATRGNLKGIIAEVEKLEQLDEKFIPFATQLRQLAQDCQVKKSNNLLVSIRKQSNDCYQGGYRHDQRCRF